MAIFDAGKSVPDIVHLQYVGLFCTRLGFGLLGVDVLATTYYLN